MQRSTAAGDTSFRIFFVSEGATVGLSGLTIARGRAVSFPSPQILEGGGIYNRGTLAISNSTLSGNRADVGGGIYNSGTLTVSNSTIAGNFARSAGGLWNGFESTVTVSNSTLSGNTAYSAGGGIVNVYGTLTVSNSTIAGNSASSAGGGIYNSSFAYLNARNTIIAGNTAPTGPDLSGNLGSVGHNLIGNDSGGSSFHPTDLLNIDPLLGPLQDNGGPTLTHALLPGSPALDAGDDGVLLPPLAFTTDQRGLPRLSGPHVDIGAVEILVGGPDIQVLDDGDTGFSATPGFVSLSGQGYQDDVHYAAAGTGSETATWTFTGLAPGLYRVSATWTPHPNRASKAPFTAYDGTPAGIKLGTVLVNQEQAPSHFSADGAAWFNLGGPYQINSGTLTVQMSDAANEYVIADAIRIERLTSDPVQIQDDGDAGFSAPGFTPFSGQGYQGGVSYALADSGSVATWTFTGLTPGTYRVSATWTEHPNRASNAPFTILDGTTPLATVTVNQEQAPDDFGANDAFWEDLGSGVYTITGNTLVVQLTDGGADEYVIADAIRIERLA